jgi:2,4-diketo-3-deoxy-L-fuconate hydrolase
MKFVNHKGRMTLLVDEAQGVDVSRASNGLLPAEPEKALERWDEVKRWAATFDGPADVEVDAAHIGPPSPSPRQLIAVGANYAAHAAEAGIELPQFPMIFPKLFAAINGPYGPVEISTGSVDWEVELGVIIGRRARRVPAEQALDVVAGFTVAQDLSEREIQARPPVDPQFSFGKSLPGFGPIGPALVTLDEFDDPNDLELACILNGEEVQRSRTSDLNFTVAELIEYATSVTELYPGDVIFTGTPAGVGATRTPPRFLAAGDVLESWIEGIGTMRHQIVTEVDKERSDRPLAGQRS